MASIPAWGSLVLTREEFEVLDLIDQRRFLQLVIEQIKLFNSYAIIIYRFPRTINGDFTSRFHLPPSFRGRKMTIPPRRQRMIRQAN
jgi:hypothetical protein